MSEVDPQNRYAEFRVHKEMRRWKEAWEASKIILHPDLKAAAIREWWMVADMDEVARLIEWSHDGDNFRWQACWCDTFASYKKWRVHLGENLIIQRKDLNLRFEQKMFARKPVEHVRYIWENWAMYNLRGYEYIVEEALKINELNCDKHVVNGTIALINRAAKMARDKYGDRSGQKAAFAAFAAAEYVVGFASKGEAKKHSFNGALLNATFAIREGVAREDWNSLNIPDWKHMFNVHLLNIVKNKALTA